MASSRKSYVGKNKNIEDRSFESQEKNLLKPFILSTEWLKNLNNFEMLEEEVFKEFLMPNSSRKWREGTSKNSFNYLLLDPRMTKDLPRRTATLNLTEKWTSFLTTIFYIGKGKRSRPYAHLYEAYKIWKSNDYSKINNKIQRILDIWHENKGIVVLHVFQNTIPVEAYTREAVMIDALGTKQLCNYKNGQYYDVITTWPAKEKIKLGRYLLFKTMKIFLLEGERQIFPADL